MPQIRQPCPSSHSRREDLFLNGSSSVQTFVPSAIPNGLILVVDVCSSQLLRRRALRPIVGAFRLGHRKKMDTYETCMSRPQEAPCAPGQLFHSCPRCVAAGLKRGAEMQRKSSLSLYFPPGYGMGLSARNDGRKARSTHDVRFGGGHPPLALFCPTSRVPLRAESKRGNTKQ